MGITDVVGTTCHRPAAELDGGLVGIDRVRPARTLRGVGGQASDEADETVPSGDVELDGSLR